MADVTRDVAKTFQEGVRDVRVYGLPFLFVAVVETPRFKSWNLGLWLTPRDQINLAFQTVNDG